MNILTEAQAAAAEKTADFITRIETILEANKAVLKSGDKSIDRVLIGPQGQITAWPAIIILEAETVVSPAEISYPPSTYTISTVISCVDLKPGAGHEVLRNVMNLTDRAVEVLMQNDLLDDGSGALLSTPLRVRSVGFSTMPNVGVRGAVGSGTFAFGYIEVEGVIVR